MERVNMATTACSPNSVLLRFGSYMLFLRWRRWRRRCHRFELPRFELPRRSIRLLLPFSRRSVRRLLFCPPIASPTTLKIINRPSTMALFSFMCLPFRNSQRGLVTRGLYAREALENTHPLRFAPSALAPLTKGEREAQNRSGNCLRLYLTFQRNERTRAPAFPVMIGPLPQTALTRSNGLGHSA